MSAVETVQNHGEKLDIAGERLPAAEYVPLSALTPWEGNPRQNVEAVKEVARSIRRFGFAAPIVARRANGEIIAGHTRYLAAKRLRLKEVPVRFLDIDENEAHALAIADNKLGELASWDKDQLSKVLAELQADDVDLEFGIGLSDAELERLIGEPDEHTVREHTRRRGDDSVELKTRYLVQVECPDETIQVALLKRLSAEGFEVKALVA